MTDRQIGNLPVLDFFQELGRDKKTVGVGEQIPLFEAGLVDRSDNPERILESPGFRLDGYGMVTAILTNQLYYLELPTDIKIATQSPEGQTVLEDLPKLPKAFQLEVKLESDRNDVASMVCALTFGDHEFVSQITDFGRTDKYFVDWKVAGAEEAEPCKLQFPLDAGILKTVSVRFEN